MKELELKDTAAVVRCEDVIIRIPAPQRSEIKKEKKKFAFLDEELEEKDV